MIQSISKPDSPVSKQSPLQSIPTTATATKISLVYALVSALWILGSGWMLHHFVHEPNLDALLENVKGWFFVAVTALLLGLALNRYFREIRRSAQLLVESEELWQFAFEGVGEGIWDWDLSNDKAFYTDVTARKRAEAELQKWANAFKHCAHGIGMGRADSNQILVCNPALARMVGRTAAEIAHAPVLSLYAPEDHERIRQCLAEADRTGQVRYEAQLIRQDGSRFPVQMDVVSVRSENGEPLYRVATAQDITERTRAQEALRQRLELQDQIARIAVTVPGMIYSFRRQPDGSTSLPFATPVMDDLFGVSPDQVRDDFSPARDRIHPDDIADFEASVEESAEKMSPWHHTFRVLHPAKGEIWLEGHSMPRREGDGSILWHGFVQDITEHKQARQALEQEAIRRRVLIEQSNDGIVVLDQDGKAYEANQKAAEMLGYSLPDMHELHVWDWDCQWNRDELLERIRAVDAEGERFETRHRRKDGSCFDVEISTNGAVVEGRKLVFCVSRDISQRKQAEKALREREEEFRTMFEMASIGMAQTDPSTGQYLRVNQRMCSITGYSAAELLQMRIADLTHPMTEMSTGSSSNRSSGGNRRITVSRSATSARTARWSG